MDFFSLLGFDQASSVSGGIGSILSLRFYGAIGWAGRISTAMGGWLCASYLTRPLLRLLKLLPVEDYTGGGGFLLGLFSMMVAAAVWKVISETHWGEVISRRISGGASGGAPSFGDGDK
jgi:hypothetical protein